MLKPLTVLSAVLAWTALGMLSPATAEAPAPALNVDAAPQAAQAIEHINITVEGQPVQVRARGLGTDDFQIEASPIFEALRSRFEARDSILAYWRFQDGAVMSLDFRDGKVRANGVVLGALPDWPEMQEDAEDPLATTWLGVNAIAVLTGTLADETPEAGWSFTLDERLKPQFDLDLWVNGAPVRVDTGLEPRTLGPVLLIPLEPVARALGHTLTRDRAAGTVTITRVQDSAVLSLEIATGLVTVNGAATGVSPNMSYADEEKLLLPFSAIETLTGSHILLEPGSQKIEISLDDRLAGAALPGERVVDEAAETPFTPERLRYQIADRGPVTWSFDSRYQGYNTTVHYETVGGVTEPETWTPRWVSVDIQALEGWRGNLGDYNAGFREFSGINVSRVRGGAFRNKRDDGTILAIAAGVPLTGSESVTDRASKPVFGGFAGGVRILSTDGQSDYGVAASVSESGGSSQIVAGRQKSYTFADDGEGGLESAYVSADVGLFNDARGTAVDVRARGEARYSVSDEVNIRAQASYDGGRFLSGAIDTTPEADFGAVFGEDVGARTTGAISMDWRASENWGPLVNLAGGLRTTATHINGANGSTVLSLSGSTSARLGQTGPDVSVDMGISSSESGGDKSQSQGFSVRAYKAFDWGNVSANYTHTDSDGEIMQRFVASGNLHAIRKDLGEGAAVSVGPSASFVWTPGSQQARLGASASVNSGQRLGEKLKVQGRLSALTSYDAEKSGANLFASAGATYEIMQNMQLQASYSDDLNGRRDFSLALRGAITFNEPRKHTRPKEGTGVLKGRVFFDRNRDGIRQKDEPGIAGIMLRVQGTRLSLKVAGDGSFTIQNMKTGLYDLLVDTRSLPLGMLVPEEADPKVTIGEGRVTSVDIPVIASGQVRGAVFVDENSNGELDAGEHRLEGQWVQLVPEDEGNGDALSIQSASFGQYGFENLSPGAYKLRTKVGGRLVEIAIELTEDDLFGVTQIAVPPEYMLQEDSAPGGGVLGTP